MKNIVNKSNKKEGIKKNAMAGPPIRPEKNTPVKPDKNPDPTKIIPGINEPEKEDPAKIDEPQKNDPFKIDDPPSNL